jgi:hypothetical protein
MSQWLFSLLFIISLTVANGEQTQTWSWPTMIHGKT